MEVCDLYENLKADVYRYARSLAKHEFEADDLVQDAFMKAMNESKLVDLPVHKQKAWFFRVIKNRMIDISRRERRLVSWEEDLDLAVFPTPSHSIEMTEWLGRLPQSQSDIVFKRYWLGMSSQEIGEQLGIPAATVRYKLQTAIKKLRKLWEDDMR
ncbi:RNA polymerase sigma-70 factor, ECF subfamily [Paenibacillus uliginis N3/975]|uniref:RNA polymerase sigma factor n=1 Tax=Paenibacillus uliginis N3/975 TaxID=1313296 RepID=A0A1X7HNH9_9BACL|nr:RNA polymerase sigma factor [Paenibacillus uliginis]SMF89975.1 RNA polymerase sigma-70 factor, ECF subfamily [Paenibacillus uliginis N3/975]